MAPRPPPAVRQDGRSGAFGPLRSRSARRRSASFGSFRRRSLATRARETSAPSGGLRGAHAPSGPARLPPRPARPGASRDPRARETSAPSGGRGRAGVREASGGLGGRVPAQEGAARGSSEPLGASRGRSFGRFRLGGRAAPKSFGSARRRGRGCEGRAGPRGSPQPRSRRHRHAGPWGGRKAPEQLPAAARLSRLVLPSPLPPQGSFLRAGTHRCSAAPHVPGKRSQSRCRRWPGAAFCQQRCPVPRWAEPAQAPRVRRGASHSSGHVPWPSF